MKQTQDEVKLDDRFDESQEGTRDKLKQDIQNMEDRFYRLKDQDPGKFYCYTQGVDFFHLIILPELSKPF